MGDLTPIEEMDKAVRCLALEVPASVHEDVTRIWQGVLKYMEGMLAPNEEGEIVVQGHKVYVHPITDGSIGFGAVNDDRPLVRMIFEFSPEDAAEIAGDLLGHG